MILAVAAGGLVDDLHHMHRHPDGAGLVGDGPGDGLANPPGGICRELVPLGIVKLVHGANEARVALLNEVENVESAPGVLLRDGHHQPEVGLGQLVLGLLVALGHLPRQLDLFLGAEELHLADLLEVHPHRVVQIVLRSQLHRVHQGLVFVVHIQIQVGIQGGFQIQIQLGAQDLNAHGFKGIVDLFDLFHGQIQLFQLRIQLRGLDGAFLPGLGDQRGHRGLDVVRMRGVFRVCHCLHILIPNVYTNFCKIDSFFRNQPIIYLLFRSDNIFF